MRHQRAESPALLNGPEAAHRFFAACFSVEDRRSERLFVAHVDESARCIHIERYVGDRWGTDLPIGSIVRDATRLGSSGVVLAHKHPSGDPTPSTADCQATRALARVGESIDLTILDHLIFAGPAGCSSMRRMGLL
jgi:DNA repair protein RadC